jgi:hypothetical protein
MISEVNLADQLRQMIAVLTEERQALAALDLDSLMVATGQKLDLCDALDADPPETVDAECRELLKTAQQINEVNRRVRNLLAANVAARLDALAGRAAAYQVPQMAAG